MTSIIDLQTRSNAHHLPTIRSVVSSYPLSVVRKVRDRTLGKYQWHVQIAGFQLAHHCVYVWWASSFPGTEDSVRTQTRMHINFLCGASSWQSENRQPRPARKVEAKAYGFPA